MLPRLQQITNNGNGTGRMEDPSQHLKLKLFVYYQTNSKMRVQNLRNGSTKLQKQLFRFPQTYPVVRE